MKFKNEFKNGTRVEVCFYPELEGKTGVVEGTVHDYCNNPDSFTYFHNEWVRLRLDDGTIKHLLACFVREIK